jgi:DNA topoisomerase VI subunit B
MVRLQRELRQQGATSGLGSLRYGGRPVVLEYRSKGRSRKKPRYSKGLEDVQELEAGVSKAVRRTARAAEKGTSTYDRARRRSARRKRDGTIKDFGPNMGEALSEALREASKIPAEVADTLDTRPNQRRLRRGIREASRATRAWRV